MELRIAFPTNDRLNVEEHFGHCAEFKILNTKGGKIVSEEFLTPPVHEPGVYPKFLADKGVTTIIAGGMGGKAQDLLTQNNIEVFMGINSEIPEALVEQYLQNKLVSGENQCDH